MDLEAIGDRQDGVVSRTQVLGAGGDDTLIERRLRRREWARVHPGAYVDHTGPPTFVQRAWAAVLLHAPAALDAGSALHVGRPGGDPTADPRTIDLVVAEHRRMVDPPGVRTRRVADFEAVCELRRAPPRIRLEHAVLRAASRARDPDRAVAVIEDALQSRRTTAVRLAETLAGLPRLPGRRLLGEIVADGAAGALGALERR